MARLISLNETVIDPAGVPLPGTQLFFYVTGTSTAANTYANSSLKTPNPNPVEADAAGRFPPIFLDPAITYAVALEDALGNVLWSADPVGGTSNTTPTAFVLSQASAPAGMSNAIVVYTDDGETLKYKDHANAVFVAATAPVVANVGSFTAVNLTVDAGGRVTAVVNGAGSGITSAEFAYIVSSGTNPDLLAVTTGAWNKRLLNTTVFNGIAGCSLANSSVTLPTGTYVVYYSMAVSAVSFSGFHVIGRLRNITDGASVADSSMISNNSGIQADTVQQSTTFTIASPKVFELDMYAAVIGGTGANAEGGYPITTGEGECYVRLTILKIG